MEKPDFDVRKQRKGLSSRLCGEMPFIVTSFLLHVLLQQSFCPQGVCVWVSKHSDVYFLIFVKKKFYMNSLNQSVENVEFL